MAGVINAYLCQMSTSKFSKTVTLKTGHETVTPGHHYQLPIYKMGEIGIEETGDFVDLTFVRGTKEQNPKLIGTLHEHLVSAMIEDLKLKNSEVPSIYGEKIIGHLEAIQQLQIQRVTDRQIRGVLNTLQK